MSTSENLNAALEAVIVEDYQRLLAEADSYKKVINDQIATLVPIFRKCDAYYQSQSETALMRNLQGKAFICDSPYNELVERKRERDQDSYRIHAKYRVVSSEGSYCLEYQDRARAHWSPVQFSPVMPSFRTAFELMLIHTQLEQRSYKDRQVFSGLQFVRFSDGGFRMDKNTLCFDRGVISADAVLHGAAVDSESVSALVDGAIEAWFAKNIAELRK